MKTTHLITALTLAGSVLLSAYCNPVQAEDKPSQSLLEAFTKNGNSQLKPSYRDSDGRTIDANAFMAAVAAGQTFQVAKDKKAGTATFSLMSADAAKPASLGQNLAIHLNQEVPPFKLPRLPAGEISSSQLIGKPTLVDFFFADCVACIEELPALNAFMTKHREMNFQAITFDDAKTASDFVNERHFSWPVAYAGKTYADKLDVHAYPTLLLLDDQGRLLGNLAGGIPIEFDRGTDKANTKGHPDPTGSAKEQSEWLEHWVTEQLAKKKNNK